MNLNEAPLPYPAFRLNWVMKRIMVFILQKERCLAKIFLMPSKKERDKIIRKAEKAKKEAENRVSELETKISDIEHKLAEGDASPEVLEEYSG